MLHLRGPRNISVSDIRDSSGKVLVAQLDHIETLDDLNLTGAVFDCIQADGLICMGAKFDNASFKAADLYWMVAIQASFENASFEDCVFRGSNLSKANFSGALLTRTRFLQDNLGDRTNLEAADFSKAVIQDADFTGACYDAETKFPDGFDPASMGLVKCQEENGSE